MRSIFAVMCILFSFLLVADLSYARKDTGDYWKSIMKDQEMPEAITDVLSDHVQGDQASDLRGSSSKTDRFARNFGDRSNAIIYHAQSPSGKTDRFAKNFGNRPNVIIYHAQKKPAEEKFETNREGDDKLIKRVST